MRSQDRVCWISTCSNSNNENRLFYPLPTTNPKLKEIWLALATKSAENVPDDQIFFCEDHFKSDDPRYRHILIDDFFNQGPNNNIIPANNMPDKICHVCNGILKQNDRFSIMSSQFLSEIPTSVELQLEQSVGSNTFKPEPLFAIFRECFKDIIFPKNFFPIVCKPCYDNIWLFYAYKKSANLIENEMSSDFEPEEYGSSILCRTCTERCSQFTTLENKSEMGNLLYNMLNKKFNPAVVPLRICSNCYQILQKINAFIKQCRKTDKIIKKRELLSTRLKNISQNKEPQNTVPSNKNDLRKKPIIPEFDDKMTFIQALRVEFEKLDITEKSDRSIWKKLVSKVLEHHHHIPVIKRLKNEKQIYQFWNSLKISAVTHDKNGSDPIAIEVWSFLQQVQTHRNVMGNVEGNNSNKTPLETSITSPGAAIKDVTLTKPRQNKSLPLEPATKKLRSDSSSTKRAKSVTPTPRRSKKDISNNSPNENKVMQTERLLFEGIKKAYEELKIDLRNNKRGFWIKTINKLYENGFDSIPKEDAIKMWKRLRISAYNYPRFNARPLSDFYQEVKRFLFKIKQLRAKKNVQMTPKDPKDSKDLPKTSGSIGGEMESVKQKTSESETVRKDLDKSTKVEFKKRKWSLKESEFYTSLLIKEKHLSHVDWIKIANIMEDKGFDRSINSLKGHMFYIRKILQKKLNYEKNLSSLEMKLVERLKIKKNKDFIKENILSSADSTIGNLPDSDLSGKSSEQRALTELADDSFNINCIKADDSSKIVDTNINPKDEKISHPMETNEFEGVSSTADEIEAYDYVSIEDLEKTSQKIEVKSDCDDEDDDDDFRDGYVSALDLQVIISDDECDL